MDPVTRRVSIHSYLPHHGLLILFLLCDLDGWQLSDSRDQEVHQDILTVGQLIHHVLQTSRQVVGVQVMVIPGREATKEIELEEGKYLGVSVLMRTVCCSHQEDI